MLYGGLVATDSRVSVSERKTRDTVLLILDPTIVLWPRLSSVNRPPKPQEDNGKCRLVNHWAGGWTGIGHHVSRHEDPGDGGAGPWIGAAGDLWVNILTGLVLPLTVAALVTAVTSQRDSGRAGRMGATSMAPFVGLMLVCSLFTLALAPPMIQWFPRDAAVGEALKQKAPAEAQNAVSKLKDVSGPADLVNTLTSKNLRHDAPSRTLSRGLV